MPPNRNALQSFIVDGSILGGTGLMSYGTWLIYHPAGLILLGALLLALGLGAAAVRR
jgi:hypothetical protein